MKVQYLGDANDYRKFALLRVLVRPGGFKIGVCWMLTNADARSDGNKRFYLRQPGRWRAFDADLFDRLADLPSRPDLADLRRIENDGVVPNAVFFNDGAPDGRPARETFHRACLARFAGCDLAFFDPDNGLEVPSRPKGRKDSSICPSTGPPSCRATLIRSSMFASDWFVMANRLYFPGAGIRRDTAAPVSFF